MPSKEADFFLDMLRLEKVLHSETINSQALKPSTLGKKP